MTLTSGEIAILIPITSLAIVQIINAAKANTRHVAVDEKLSDIRTQTNGNTDKLQKQIADQAIEIGRQQGMVQGLQTMRRGPRATDAATAETTT